MKNVIVVALLVVIFIIGFLWFVYLPNKQWTMKLESASFSHNQLIPSQYTCDGDDTNPPLVISNIPADAKSLAIVMDDPDAIKPAGKVWDHWVVFNIPISENNMLEIPENSEPDGTHGIGTSGNKKYHGPCPPDGEHRYFFKAYALDAMLNLAEGATKTEVERAMEKHIVDQAELMGTYNRRR